MLDFYFKELIPFEMLEKDEGLKTYREPDDRRYFIRLSDDDETVGWTYDKEDLWEMEGHDAAIPVAMYIFNKYGVIFGGDPRDSEMEYLDYMEWLLRNVNEIEPYKSIYEKIKILKAEEIEKQAKDMPF